METPDAERLTGFGGELVRLLQQLRLPLAQKDRSLRAIAKRIPAQRGQRTSSGNLSEIFNGNKLPRPETAYAIAKALGADENVAQHALRLAEKAADDVKRAAATSAKHVRSGNKDALGDYRYHVAGLAAASLDDRDDEIAAMAAFCADPEPALLWCAPPKAGKTALLAHFVLHPPPDVVVAAFFVHRTLAVHSDSDGYLDEIVPQLERIAGVDAANPRRTGYYQRMLEEAGQRAEAAGRRLVLVVDALDEDTGAGPGTGRASVAAMLNSVPANAKLIASAREHPDLPLDVAPGSLLASAKARMLTPAPAAAMTVRQAAEELENALVPPGGHLRRHIAGLLVASGGGLSDGDLAEIVGDPFVRGELRGSFARALRRVTVPTPTRTTWVYVYAHDTLRAYAEDYLAHDLPARRAELRSWHEQYRRDGWPQETPPYLLDGYSRLLDQLNDLPALLTNATDGLRHDRILIATATDDAALREIEAVRDRLGDLGRPSLCDLCRLGLEYERITDRAATVPKRLPAVWARLGYGDYAHRLVATIKHYKIHAETGKALAAATEGKRHLGLTKRYIRRYSYAQDVRNTADAAVILVALGDTTAAHAMAVSLREAARKEVHFGDHAEMLACGALANAAVGEFDAARELLNEALARSPAGSAARPFGPLAEAAQRAECPELVAALADEAVARCAMLTPADGSIAVSNGNGAAIWACAVAGRVDEALRLTDTLRGYDREDIGLYYTADVARAAEALAREGHVGAAERVASALGGWRDRAEAVAEVAEVLALNGAFADAEAVVDRLDDSFGKPDAMAGVAWVAAVTGAGCARRLADRAMELALGLVNVTRVVEIYAGVAAALELGGQPDVHRLAERAEAATAAMEAASSRARGFARLALTAAAGRRRQDVERLALAAKAATAGIDSGFASGAYAEAARALAVAGLEDDAVDAAKTAFYRSMRFQTPYYPWWGRTLVHLVTELGAWGLPEAWEIAGSIPVERWRDLTVELMGGTSAPWEGHDWLEHDAYLGGGRIVDFRTVDPCGQEESLEHLAAAVGELLRAGGDGAEVLVRLCAAVARSRSAWLDLLPVLAIAEPDGVNDIADHVAKTWRLA